MFQLELQPEYNPSFFSPDWLDQDRVELDWNSLFFFYMDQLLSGGIFLSSSKLWEIHN